MSIAVLGCEKARHRCCAWRVSEIRAALVRGLATSSVLNMAKISASEVLRLQRVLELTGLSRSTVYALIKKKQFPVPISLTGARARGWISEEISRWLEDKVAQRDGKV